SILQQFLDLDEDEQILYRFGRRLGTFQSLEDLHDTRQRARVIQVMSENDVNPQNIDSLIDQMMQRFL
ncbi:MAG: radical SAM protein, partial [Candidatus Thorarchaeota archaeon]|nr:radical SAM protein [Candidatus Thorarchaeota archaeon]